MKKTVMFIVLSLCTFGLTRCASTYNVGSENPSRPNVKNYRTIYIGWMDLGKEDWKKLGYDKQSAFLWVIRENNLKGLHKQMKEGLKGKKVLVAYSENYSPAGDLLVKFSDTHIERAYSAFSGVDYMHTHIEFIDLRNRMKIYDCKLKSASRRWGPNQWSFEGRTGFSVLNIADFVISKIK